MRNGGGTAVSKHIVEFLHFEGFKKIVVDHTIFQLTSRGDEFYIIRYQNKKAIKLLYPVKMYEYREK